MPPQPPSPAPPPQRPVLPSGKAQRSLRSITALMLREMSTRYGGSPGGYLWAVLEPVGAIMVISLALSLIIRVPSLGNSFLLFYATGYLAFTLYMLIQTTVSASLDFSRPLLMYPSVSWIDAVLARFFLNLLTGIAIVFIVLFGILWFSETNAILEAGPILSAVALMALLGFGHGTLNCVLFGLFPVWKRVWSILSRPLMIVSGVFFIFEDMPRNVQEIGWWTPWIHATTLLRQGVYPTYEPSFVSIPLVLAWSLIPLAFGLLLLRRHRHTILMR